MQSFPLDRVPFDIDPLYHRSCCAASCATSGDWRIVLVVMGRESFGRKQVDGDQQVAAADTVAMVIGMKGLAEGMQSRSAAVAVVAA